MRWLVTSRATADRGWVEAELRACGCRIEDEGPPVVAAQLDLDEDAIEVEGPPDLAERLRDSEAVLSVRPAPRADPA